MTTTSPRVTRTAEPRTAEAIRPDTLWAKFNVHRVPAGKIVATAFASYIIVALGWLAGAPIWAAFGIALIPWVPIAFLEVEWTYKHYGWFVIFFAMAIVQTIHYSEHVIEVIQVHIFNQPVAQSLAIFSKLNVEGVHFFGDTFLTLGTMALLWKFPRNPWLWVAAPFQILHQAEHTFLFSEHVIWGYAAGGPGLFAYKVAAHGHPALSGALGSFLNRPDLHWIYNTLFTIPFVIALIYQLKRTYDEALDEAFPTASKSELIAASKHVQTFTYEPGETIVAPGDPAHRVYLITEGEASVIDVVDGRETEVATLSHGKLFGEDEIAMPGAVHDKTFVAKTRLTVLALEESIVEKLEAPAEPAPGPTATAGIAPPPTAPAV